MCPMLFKFVFYSAFGNMEPCCNFLMTQFFGATGDENIPHQGRHRFQLPAQDLDDFFRV